MILGEMQRDRTAVILLVLLFNATDVLVNPDAELSFGLTYITFYCMDK